MGVNPPDPTQYEQYDKDVADARNLLLEFIGNCAPVTYRAEVLARRSPLALGLLVVACLTEVRDDDFSPVQLATMRGEAHRDRHAKPLVNELLAMVEGGYTPEDVTIAGPEVDSNTLPYRQHTTDSITRRDLMRVDWQKLAADFTDNETDWAGYTDEHDTRGCWTCLNSTCMVGYEEEEVLCGDSALEVVECDPHESDNSADSSGSGDTGADQS